MGQGALVLCGVSGKRLREAFKSAELKVMRGSARGWLVRWADLQLWVAGRQLEFRRKR